MRTDILDVADILRSRDGVRGRYELRLQSGGETVTDFDSTYRTVTDSPGIPTEPIPQDVALIDGIAVSIMAHSGVIKLQSCFAAIVSSEISCDTYSRPSIRDYDETRFQIAYAYNSEVFTALVDKATFLSANVISLSDTTQITGIPSATSYALHLIRNDELVIFYISNGGIRVYSTLYDTSSLTMYYPTYTYSETETDDMYRLNWSGACVFDGTIFAYFSMYDGSVQAFKMHESAQTWSDMYEAVASDLSEFRISKASTYNGKVILSGQFNRVDPTGAFDSPYIYGMVLSSSDGDVFAIDRHSLFSFGNEDESDDGARRFFALGIDAPDYRYGTGGPAFIYYGGGTLAIGKCKYTVAPQQYTTTILKLTSMSGSYNDGWALKSGNMPLEIYDSIKLGDAADIYMAIPDELGVWGNWFMLQHGTITRKTRSEEDGKITTDLEFEPWGASRLNDMTWPYYVELQGKQSIRDDCDEWDNLYRASEDGFLIGQFYADFFGEGTCDPKEAAAGGSCEWLSGDLSTTYYLSSDPEISVLPITIKLYGWSRPGHTVDLTTGGGTEPSDPNAENCTISARLHIKRGEDEYIRTITTLADEGETAHFPRTFQTAESGYYPVTLEATAEDGLEVGDKITKVAMVFTNPNGSDATLNYAERVEIPEVGMHFYTYEDTWREVTESQSIEVGETFTWDGTYNDPDARFVAEYIGNGVMQFTHTFTGGLWQNIGSNVNIVIPSHITAGEYNFSYECSGTYPSSGYDTLGTNIPRLMYYVYLRPIRNEVITDLGSGHYLVTGIITVTEADITLGTWSFGWATTLAGRWQNYATSVRTSTAYNFTLDDLVLVPEIVTEENVGQQLQATGIPVLYFSQKPYYTINCEVAAEYKLAGPQAYGGVVALAKDAQNYICARMSITDIELVKYRGGIETVLATTTHTHDETYGEWIKLKVEDGKLTVRKKSGYVLATDWSDILLEYTWQESDGDLIVEKDISHVGIYAYKDAPWMRITGFDPAQGGNLGVLPPGEDFDEFPSSGTIKIDDCTYSYSGKQNPGETWGGPYQGRNVTDWGSYSNDGASYNGNAAEFIRFEYLTNSSHLNDFDAFMMAVETGFAWSISEVDYKPFITTRGVRINLRNRGRFFGPSVAGDVVGMSTRVWLTAALTGLARTTGEDTTHTPGALAFLDSTTSVILLEFAASSGHGPLTDRDMISIVCRLSDAEARFPGDNEISSMTLSGTPQQVNP